MTDTSNNRVSISVDDIEVPSKPSERSLSTIERLIQLRDSFGPKPNKNELAIALIRACIECGWSEKTQIFNALMRLGLHHGHIGSILSKSSGFDPNRHLWFPAEDGRYELLAA